jgi:hypothetical protein
MDPNAGTKYIELKEISHLLYMDDLKLGGRSREELRN